MIHHKKFKDDVFSIEIKTDDLRILHLIDGLLDFPAVKVQQKARFNISFNIFKNDTDCQKFINSGWELSKAKPRSSFGLRIADAQISFNPMAVKVEYRGNWEGYKENFLNFIFFQPIRALLEKKGYFYLHGAALVKEGTCVFITGRQGCGKSSLSLSLMQDGFKFICDDDCFLGFRSGELSVLPLRTKIGIKENTAMRWEHLKLPVVKDFIYGGKKRSSLNKKYDRSSVRSYTKYVILFPQYEALKRMKLVPIFQEKALSKIVKEHLVSHPEDKKSQNEQFFLLYGLTKKARAYELFYSDNDLGRIGKKLLNESKIRKF